jgi:hypothetical protein
MRLAQRCPKAILLTWHHDQMNMIRHQAISPNLCPCFFRELRHQLNVIPIIILAEKRLLTTIATLSHVMRVTWNDNTRHPGHIEPPCSIALPSNGSSRLNFGIRYTVPGIPGPPRLTSYRPLTSTRPRAIVPFFKFYLQALIK